MTSALSLITTCESCRTTFPLDPSPSVTKIHSYISSHPGNHIASDTDRPSLVNHIRGARDELGLYDDEVTKLAVVLSELKARRGSLSRAITEMEGMVKQSVRRLPVEILRIIFWMCCNDLDVKSPASLNPTSTPNPNAGWPALHPALTLSLVCSRWRSIVHTSPYLWSKILISIVNPQHIISVSNMIHRLTQFCLDKSQTQPLQISFGRCYPGNLSLAYAELVKHSSRWASVQLFYLPQCGEFPVHLPLLEDLVLGGYSSGSGTGFPEKVYSPRLRTLEVTHDAVGLGRRFDLGGVTRLVLRDTVHGDGVFPILRECSALSELVLDGVSFDRLDQGGGGAGGGGGGGGLRIEGLRELKILNPGFLFPFNVFFGHITLPSLTKLTISITHSPGTGAASSGSHRVFFDARTSAAFKEFVERSGRPMIGELTFGHINFYDIQDLLDILTIYSESLTRLSLVMCSHYSKRWDELLERMTLRTSVRARNEGWGLEGQQQRGFMPNMKNLEIEFHRWSERSEQLLFGMAESRWRCDPERRLAELKVVCGEGDKGAIKNTLGALREEGLPVTVERV